jgi:hypothetical protein
MERESVSTFLQEMIDRLEDNQATEEEEEFLYETYIQLRATFTPAEIFL